MILFIDPSQPAEPTVTAKVPQKILTVAQTIDRKLT